MRTSKPISTISYNTSSFLLDALNRLKYLGYISYFEFIQHVHDNDDDSDHIHLYVEPRKIIDTDDIDKYFIEPVSNSDKPLKCIFWKNSKFGDWYWYVLHDKDYLKSKMLVRNCFYSDSDIISSDYDTHRYKVVENPLINYAYMSDTALRDYIFQCVNNGYSLQYLLNTCNVPLGKVQSVIHFYNALAPYYAPKYAVFQSPASLSKKVLKKAGMQHTDAYLQLCGFTRVKKEKEILPFL